VAKTSFFCQQKPFLPGQFFSVEKKRFFIQWQKPANPVIAGRPEQF